MMSDLFGEFRDAVRLDEVCVKRPTQIFLCGGRNPKPDEPGRPKSARHAFYRHLQQVNSPLLGDIVLAEVIVGDREQGDHGLTDILKVEELVAEIVGVILLFIESPGSYAELGAFTANKTILRRLVVVNDNYFRERTESFIYQGPLKRLFNTYDQSLKYFTWLNDHDSPVLDEDLAHTMAVDLSEFVPEFQKRNAGKARLSTAGASGGKPKLSEGELMCLITGLLDVFVALGLEEIEQALRKFASLESDLNIKRYLYVLRKLDLVGRVSDSKQQSWYYSRRSLVDWSFQPTAKSKTWLDWRLHFVKAYERARTTDRGARKRLDAMDKIMLILTGDEHHG